MWALYLSVHSLLASSRMKQLLNLPDRQYRLGYSLISIVGLIYLLYLMAFMPKRYLFAVSAFGNYIGAMIASVGLYLIMASFKNISKRQFVGLQASNESKLVTTGLHAHMRHPIYAGTVLIMFGMFLAVPNMAVLIATFSVLIYLPFGIYWEEQKLIATYGDEYIEYKKSVKAIIPRIL